jgi:PGF-CTERM protein
MIDKLPTHSKTMNVSRTNWHLICVVVVVMVAGFVGVGSAQQTATTTTATAATTTTTTNTSGQDTLTAGNTTVTIATVEGVETVSAASTTPLQSTTRTSTSEPDDIWRNATPIDLDIRQSANGTLPGGDQDWYVFSVDSAGTITVRLAAANQTNMSGFLYNSEGTLIDSSYVDPGGQIPLTGQANSSGEYYVFVRNEANDTGAYAFTISIEKSETASGEDQPQSADGSSSGGGPGFGLLGSLVAILVAGYLVVRTTNNSE